MLLCTSTHGKVATPSEACAKLQFMLVEAEQHYRQRSLAKSSQWFCMKMVLPTWMETGQTRRI